MFASCSRGIPSCGGILLPEEFAGYRSAKITRCGAGANGITLERITREQADMSMLVEEGTSVEQEYRLT